MSRNSASSGVQDGRPARWGPVDEQVEGEVTHRLGPVAHHEALVGQDHRDHIGVQVPALEDLLQGAHVGRLGDDQHPLLRLTEHHLVWGHARLASRGAGNIDLDAAAASMRELGGAPAQPGRPEILHRDHAWIASQLEARLHQALLEKRVADLHRGTARGALRIQHHRREAGPMDAVAAGVGAHQEHEIAGATGGRAGQPALLDDANAHCVDQTVDPVRLVEIELATDCRHADAVAVSANTGHNSVEQMALTGLVERTEAKRIQQCDRPRSHGEDVSQDPAHPGRRPLVRLDRARVVV